VNKSEHIKKGLIEALEKSLGVVTTACKQVGIGRTTFYNYYNEDKDFAKKVDEIENVALDFAESQLHKQIQDGSTAATIFLLKTRGKKRGYVERQEITGADGIPKDVKIEIIDANKDTE
jgi:predicted DNA-binding transcriptional regulator AlpA|tara:strand:- start:29 stop:385 length:357 start_codon:yes stop_codon:yes gene_type:complete